MFMKHSLLNITIAFCCFSISCSPESKSLSDVLMDSPTGKKLLYVASGTCYAGGVTTSTGSSTIAAFDVTDGRLERVVVDYNTLSPGDTPIGITEYDANRILVLVENASGRRIDLVNKNGSAIVTYLVNATAMGSAVRSITKLSDNSLLISKSSAIEKFSSGKARVTQGANPYVNAPGLGCATSTTLISSVASLPNGKIVFAHAAATPNNKLGMISASGYATTADCLTSQAAPATTALPTALLYHSSGKLLAAFGSTTSASNSVQAYDVDQTANTISSATTAFFDAAVINGPSAIAEDPRTGDVFVANGNSAFNSIEKFAFAPTTKALSRQAGPPFLGTQIYTRCVTDMKVLSE
jgi:hypothetical protein